MCNQISHRHLGELTQAITPLHSNVAERSFVHAANNTLEIEGMNRYVTRLQVIAVSASLSLVTPFVAVDS